MSSAPVHSPFTPPQRLAALFNSESLLFVQLLRTYFSTDPLSQTPDPLPDPIRWQPIETLATTHAVLPLIYHSIRRNFPPNTLPPSVNSSWKAICDENVSSNLALTGEMLRLCALFQRHGIQAVPIKGPVLAHSAYGDLGLRTIRDLDFVLRKKDVLPARDLLISEGFTLQSSLHWNSDAAHLRSLNSEFTMQGKYISIDLHWRLLPDYFPFDMDSDTLWSDCTTQTIAGRQIPAFSPEHQLLYFAAHGAKHYWSRLQWVCDIARFIQVMPLNWDRAFQLCHSAGNPRMLTHALALTRLLLPVPLPSEVVSRIDGEAEDLALAIAEAIFQGLGDRLGLIETAKFLNGIANGPLGLLRFTHALTLAPTEAEWACIQLPSVAYPLYYPIRLGRLAAKYTIGRFLN